MKYFTKYKYKLNEWLDSIDEREKGVYIGLAMGVLIMLFFIPI